MKPTHASLLRSVSAMLRDIGAGIMAEAVDEAAVHIELLESQLETQIGIRSPKPAGPNLQNFPPPHEPVRLSEEAKRAIREGRILPYDELWSALLPAAPNMAEFRPLPFPDLSRTDAALQEFDASGEHWFDNGPLARAVGEAFGLDTADRNDPAACASLIRPGPAAPRLGETDVSYVRRCVRLWRAVTPPLRLQKDSSDG